MIPVSVLQHIWHNSPSIGSCVEHVFRNVRQQIIVNGVFLQGLKVNLAPFPGGRKLSKYKRQRDSRQKIGMKLLQETNLG